MGNSSSRLSRAIYEQDVDKVKRLLASKGPSINGAGSKRIPPIIECVSSGFRRGDEEDKRRCEILKLLVQHGADLNVQCQTDSWLLGKTAAIVAAERGFVRCLQILFDSGADLNITTPDGDTALILAASWGQADAVKYLVEHMSVSMLNHRNDEGKTALLVAASESEFDFYRCMRHLVVAGADINVKDGECNTALMLSVKLEQEDRVELLTEHVPAIPGSQE